MPIIGSRWDAERCKYIETVNSVLQSHKAPSLKEFKISLYVNKSVQCTVTKWLEFVLSRQVERLELDLLCEEPMCMVALEEVLRGCLPQNLIGFKSIKRLCLRCLKVSGEAIDLFLRNCPLLEKLYIHRAVLTSDVVVCGPTLALQHFDIYCCSGEYSTNGEYSINVSAPNLTRLRIDSTSPKLLLENIPKLIGADYTCISPSSDYAKHFASAVFSCISRLEILSLILHHPKAFFAHCFPRMPKLKKLVVDYSGVFEHGLLPVTALIWASPSLEEFELKFMKMPRDETTWKEGITNFKRQHPHQRLKVFKFTGFLVCASDLMELLTCIIANCVALDKIIIGSSPSFRYLYNLHPRAVKDRLKQHLHGKVPDHIQLHLV